MKLNTKYAEKFIEKTELKIIEQEIKDTHLILEKGSGPGADLLGWLHLPSSTSRKDLAKIEEVASSIKDSSDAFIAIGIGGSYLGSRAAIEFLRPSYQEGKPAIYFAGNNLDTFSLHNLIDKIKDKEVSVNVISKSGATTEPAVAFRIIKDFLKKRYSPYELRKRIIFTTTKGRGPLWKTSKKEGYRCFCIPENVGGRFSVLTAVGLLPMSVAGIDISSLIKGASDIEAKSKSTDIGKNLSYRYAAFRNLLYRNGKRIEIMSSFHVRAFHVLEWWKQLFAESEGKDGRGLFPVTAIFSTDLHSIGQLIQEGERNIFETFLRINKRTHDIKIPYAKDNIDNLNYLYGKGIDFANRMAYKGTALAHMEGDVPNMTITIDEPSAYCLGELIYFFERAVGASGYLLGINPFDQPGVEAYKKNMFRLLGKPH